MRNEREDRREEEKETPAVASQLGSLQPVRHGRNRKSEKNRRKERQKARAGGGSVW